MQVPNDDLKEEVKYWKMKFEEINPKMQKIKMEKEISDEENSNLKIEISKLNKTIRKL